LIILLILIHGRYYCYFSITTTVIDNDNNDVIINWYYSHTQIKKEWSPSSSQIAHGAALISVSLALSQTPAYTARPQDTGLASVSRSVPVYSPAFAVSLVLIASTYGGMSRLSWPGWLVTYRDGLPVRRRSSHPSTNRVWRRVTSLIETNALPLKAKPPNKYTQINT